MIAGRDFKLLSTAEISSYLLETALNGDFQKSEYDEIMAELETRDIHPEVLASLVVLGDPEWYADRLRIVHSKFSFPCVCGGEPRSAFSTFMPHKFSLHVQG